MTLVRSNRKRPRTAALAVLAVTVAFLAPVHWDQDAFSRAFGFPTGFEELTPVPEMELAGMRGGFLLPNGMNLAFRLDFKAYVDGEVVSHQFFDLNDPSSSNIESEIISAGGVVHTLAIDAAGDATVTLSGGEIQGVMSRILNDASGRDINMVTAIDATIEQAGGLVTRARSRSIGAQIRSSSLNSLR